ncbi:helix-turn-helix transcriptional regulator [bacterium]|nr:helix-turn-helix transcriptional regulator [bacterium]MBQ9149561.1 helix-turn-helix transcriptional regulator [bacterium]
MSKIKKKYSSLAEFISSKREEQGLTQEDLSEKSSLTIEQIQSIEQGLDLFLPSTIRQKLAKGLKLDNKEIKIYEVKTDFALAKNATMETIREEILLNSQNPNHTIACPICGEKLITRIAKLYDLEDNLILRPKARCSKCPFQLTD